MKIIIASDHKGYKLKNKLIKYLNNKKIEVFDYGTDNDLNSVDYPKYAFLVGEDISNNKADFGIVICGTGIGISIACNKVKGIRCSKVDTVKEAKLTRLDNDSNVLAVNGNMCYFKAKKIVDTYINTTFSNADRHIKRLELIANYENGK